MPEIVRSQDQAGVLTCSIRLGLSPAPLCVGNGNASAHPGPEIAPIHQVCGAQPKGSVSKYPFYIKVKRGVVSLFFIKLTFPVDVVKH